MKKIFLFAAITAFLTFTSCTEKMNDPSMRAERVNIDVRVISGSSATKATGNVNTTESEFQTTEEATVQNLQVLVFNGEARDGYAEVTAFTGNEYGTTVSCTAGNRDIFCIVNAPSLADVTTKTALLAKASNLAEDADKFEMVGSLTDQTITADGASVFTIGVKRIASKIVIKNIENALTVAGEMTLRRVFISNVAGENNYALDAVPDVNGIWYNRGGYQAENNLGSFTNDVALDAAVANGASYTTNHYFYAYPNNNAQAGYAAAWAPKRTMLVVQIEYDGKLYDYPVDLGVDLEPNKMYVINNLKLVNLGNQDDGEEGGEDEEDPITGATAEVSVTVVDWIVVILGNESGEIQI